MLDLWLVALRYINSCVQIIFVLLLLILVIRIVHTRWDILIFTEYISTDTFVAVNLIHSFIACLDSIWWAIIAHNYPEYRFWHWLMHMKHFAHCQACYLHFYKVIYTICSQIVFLAMSETLITNKEPFIYQISNQRSIKFEQMNSLVWNELTWGQGSI